MAVVALIVAIGIGCAASWGTLDFLSRIPSKELGAYQSTLLMNLFDLFLLSVFVVLFDSSALGTLESHPYQLVVNILAGACTFGALLSLFKGYVSGVMSVVSPVASAYPVVTIVLGFFILRTGVSIDQGLGVTVIFLGMFLSGVKIKELRQSTPHGKRLVAGLDYGLFSFVMLGVVFFGLAVAAVAFGFILPVLIMRGASSITGIAFLKPTGRKLKVPSSRAVLVLAMMAVLDTFAFVAYNFAFLSALSALPIVVTVAGQFAIFTVLLARVFYKEKIDIIQYVGIAMVFAGIAAISYF